MTIAASGATVSAGLSARRSIDADMPAQDRVARPRPGRREAAVDQGHGRAGAAPEAAVSG